MKKRFILITIMLLIISFLMFLPCESDLYCTGPYADVIQYPFIWFMLLVPLSIFALFLNEEKHKFWLKFTGVFFIISMVLVYMMPEYGAGMLSPDRELTNWFFAGLYTFISIIYFIVQFFKSRRNRIG